MKYISIFVIDLILLFLFIKEFPTTQVAIMGFCILFMGVDDIRKDLKSLKSKGVYIE